MKKVCYWCETVWIFVSSMLIDPLRDRVRDAMRDPVLIIGILLWETLLAIFLGPTTSMTKLWEEPCATSPEVKERGTRKPLSQLEIVVVIFIIAFGVLATIKSFARLVTTHTGAIR